MKQFFSNKSLSQKNGFQIKSFTKKIDFLLYFLIKKRFLLHVLKVFFTYVGCMQPPACDLFSRFCIFVLKNVNLSNPHDFFLCSSLVLLIYPIKSVKFILPQKQTFAT